MSEDRNLALPEEGEAVLRQAYEKREAGAWGDLTWREAGVLLFWGENLTGDDFREVAEQLFFDLALREISDAPNGQDVLALFNEKRDAETRKRYATIREMRAKGEKISVIACALGCIGVYRTQGAQDRATRSARAPRQDMTLRQLWAPGSGR